MSSLVWGPRAVGARSVGLGRLVCAEGIPSPPAGHWAPPPSRREGGWCSPGPCQAGLLLCRVAGHGLHIGGEGGWRPPAHPGRAHLLRATGLLLCRVTSQLRLPQALLPRDAVGLPGLCHSDF